MTVTIQDVVKHLQQLRATLAHALKQPNIGARKFNEIREQILPLDEQLRNLGVDPEPLTQMHPNYVRPTRQQRRERRRAAKYPSYEQRLRKRMEPEL